jgi:short-subunit dehydrogenase
MSTSDAGIGTCEASHGSMPPLTILAMIFAFPTVFWFVAYLIPQLYMVVRPVPDLKKRYNAEWALVTGGGSGIGKALAFKLASQGLNIVIVSLDDNFLKSTMRELAEMYPKQSFRAAGVTFSPGVDYMAKINAATKDIDVPIVFNNAGFMVTGFLDQTPIGKLLANIECNATASVNISHFFVQKLVAKKAKGCIVFTSSVAGFIPTPFAAMYASTKAFVSQFAACLHIEVQSLGIDVCAIHPSPVKSQFYTNLDHKVDMIEKAATSAVSPDEKLADTMLKSIGVCALRDMGGRYQCFASHSIGCSTTDILLTTLQDWRGERGWALFSCRTTFLPKPLQMLHRLCPTGRLTTSIVRKYYYISSTCNCRTDLSNSCLQLDNVCFYLQDRNTRLQKVSFGRDIFNHAGL